jgi:hypothetical protein
MIASGEKKEEYREIKPYWERRLGNVEFKGGTYIQWFDEVHFRNGYSKDCPKLNIECGRIRIGQGKEEWGAEAGVKYFVIELGEILK